MVNPFIKHLAILALTITCFVPRLRAQEYVGGTLLGNTVFSPALNPYIVIEPLIVPEGVTLTIEPGTNLFFMIQTSIRVEGGTLIAMGDADSPIHFDAQTDKKWDGINFRVSRTEMDENGNYLSGSILDYVSINYTTTGLVLSDTALLYAEQVSITNANYGVTLQSGSTLLMNNSTLDHCSYGMYIKNSDSNNVSNCMISNCDIGIFFPSNNTSRYNQITNNNISYNSNIALFMSIGQGNMQYNLIHGNTVTYNNIGLHIGNGGPDDNGFNVISENIVRYNDIGIKLSQDADTLKGNNISLNATGLLLAKASKNKIENNFIHNNSAWGLTLTDGSSGNLITHNNIFSNESGVKITHKDFKYSMSNTLSYNAVNDNLNEAFLFEAGPQMPLQFNTITGVNSSEVFVNHFESDIIATGNFWGTSDTTLIDNLIYDVHDEETYGEVFYKPMLDYPDPESPISRPKMVVKQLTEQGVLVSWINNTEVDLAGYKAYYGTDGMTGFDGFTDVGADTITVFNTLALADPIAVTAYDTDADGNTDQFEGHESAYSYAIAGPYAGENDRICQGEAYITSSATSLNNEYLQWTTSGDGQFLESEQLVTSYIPGEEDVLAGSVVLTLSQVVSGLILSDETELLISGIPMVFAGNDTIINQYNAYHTVTAEASNFDVVTWITMGDGEFEEQDQLETLYWPGNSDIESGSVQLILALGSECGNLRDTVLVEIIPSFSINGRVSRNNYPVEEAIIVAIKAGETGSRAVSTENTMPDGTFSFSNLAIGNYYLYALNNPDTYPKWTPTYYAISSFWQGAYLMPLTTDVFDVDIELNKISDQLPAGIGSISGYFNYAGKTGDDDSIYNKPWFSDNFYQNGSNDGLPAANHVVLLMDKELNRVLAWALTASDGSFHFDNLPFGSYRLWGEKAGYTNSLSPVLMLSPLNTAMENVQLSVEQKSIKVTLPEAEFPETKVWFYPNPAKEKIWLNEPAIGEFNLLEIRIIDTFGRVVKSVSNNFQMGSLAHGIDLSDLACGFYIIRLTSDTGLNYTGKLTIVR